jgi:Ser/Thr protein kinase RdoA (MazF antagonist)
MGEPDRVQLDLARLEAILDRRAIEVTPLAGATSSHLYRVDLDDGRRVVARTFRAERWASSCAELSQREATVLRALQASDLAAPRVLGTFPDNGVIMSWLPGAVLLPRSPEPNWLGRLAARLAQIHASRIRVPYRYESWNDGSTATAPRWWRDAAIWQAAQDGLCGPPAYEPTFIHRDYHPVNVLWQNGRISGVVDWINACMGPAGVDVAHCRLNLALMYGTPAASAFLAAYCQQRPGYDHEPFWDLDDAMGAVRDLAPYAPWAEFGLTGITSALVRERFEAVDALP